MTTLGEPVGASDRLDLARIVALAERESGAFGLAGTIENGGLESRVAALVDRVNAYAPYARSEVREMQAQIVRVLANRLRVALDRQRYPGIAETPIERPLFIIGFARSGTTMLHSLLSQDPTAIEPQSWHMYAPSPPPGAGPIAQGRIDYADRMVAAWSDFAPAQKMLHPYVDKGAFQPIEDEELFALDFRSAYPFHFYKLACLEPAMTLLSSDQAGAFRFHRELLQHLSWNTGKSRWICKGPSHQMNLAALLEVYPDALCVWAHRPIGEIYASNVAIRAATFDAIRHEPVDWSSQAKAHVQGMKAAVDRLVASDLIDDPRILHLSFREIAADPIAAVRKVYAKQDRTLDAASQDAMQAWLADPENASDRFGRYPYSYEAFGLDRAWVEGLFAEYSTRFGLD